MASADYDMKGQERIRSSFAEAELMTLLGATLVKVEPGLVEVALMPNPVTSQACVEMNVGAVASIAETAANLAGLSQMVSATRLRTIELQINFLETAQGDRVLARGQVVKVGAKLTITKADVFASRDGDEKLVAIMTATMQSDDPSKG